MRKVKRIKSNDPCCYGCDEEYIIINRDSRFEMTYPAECKVCGRKYKFSVILDQYPEGDVLAYVLQCLTETSRDSEYDSTYNIILRVPDEEPLPAGDKQPKLHISNFLSGDDN